MWLWTDLTVSRPENSYFVNGNRLIVEYDCSSMESVSRDMNLLELGDAKTVPDDVGWQLWWQSFLRGKALPLAAAAPAMKMVDLFCGAGGFGLGASLAARAHGSRAHFERIVDADGEALDVYKTNLSVGRAFNVPVSSLVDYQFRKRRGVHEFSYPPEIVVTEFQMDAAPDLLIAGPPCQGHSNLNNHTRRDDPRNDLLFCTVAIGVALEARAMVIENVAAIERAKGDPLEIVRELLLGSGYEVDGSVVGADYLGWPQTRRRYFLTAIRSDCRGNDITELPNRAPQDVMWAIGDLARMQDREEVFDEPPQQKEENRARIEWLFDNDEHNLPNSERPDCHKNGTTYGAVYGRMHGNRPAPTITTGIGTPGQGRFIHPTERRLITPHEAARIQGFPDSYRFFKRGDVPKRKNLAKWIGDAVPSILGYHVCSRVLGSLKSKT